MEHLGSTEKYKAENLARTEAMPVNAPCVLPVSTLEGLLAVLGPVLLLDTYSGSISYVICL